MLEPAVAALAAPFPAWAAKVKAGRVAVLCHSDADGLAAGAILARTFERLGATVAVEVTGKGEAAWSPGVAARLASHAPAALVVADLGCRDEHILPGVPTLFIDHHRPAGVPLGDTLLTGYGTAPTPTSGLLALACAASVGKTDGVDWIAAVSLLSDLGDKAPFALLQDIRARHKITHLRDATALLNAPRRGAAGDARPALDLLLAAAEPKAIFDGRFAETALLMRAKAEVAAAMDAAKRAAPIFAGNVALLRLRSPCQVHPLIAQIWRTRLPKQIVIAANAGYLPGRVNFSARTATGVNLLDFFRANAPADAGDAYGHGHDQASGGSLPYESWDGFVARLGFGPDARAAALPGVGTRQGVPA